MYVLVFAPNGIVGQDGSWARLYRTFDEAQAAMMHDVDDYIADNELDDGDFSIDDFHATADLSCEDAPEWHVYEARW